MYLCFGFQGNNKFTCDYCQKEFTIESSDTHGERVGYFVNFEDKSYNFCGKCFLYKVIKAGILYLKFTKENDK